MRIALFCCAILSSLLSQGFYPITPRPLRKLVIESEYIIRGKVIKVGRDTLKKEDYKRVTDYAIVSVKEVLQGQLRENEVRINFTSAMICPEPGVFYENEEVLTFIDKIDAKQEKGSYSIHALSYGVKHGLDEKGFSIYKARINEMQDMVREPNTPEQQQSILEWLVRCAEEPVTRWEGVAELYGDRDRMSYYNSDGDLSRKEIYLGSSQRKRLFEAMMKSDTLFYPELMLADVIKGVDDGGLLEKLKAGLILLDINYLWLARDIMSRIVDLTENNDLDVLYTKFVELELWTDKGEAKGRKLYNRFVGKMKDAPLRNTSLTVDRVTG
jgi:hypothetical protein